MRGIALGILLLSAVIGGLVAADMIIITKNNEIEKQCREAFYSGDELTLEMLCE